MAWVTPKTDWKVTKDSKGNYIGDYFNVEDYNRIKNNMVHIFEMASLTPPDFGDDKVCNLNTISPIYAREINAFENAIEYLKMHVADLDTGDPTEYFQNGRAITYTELNRIESAQLKYYNYLS
jgi:hypothetical protein